MHRNAGQGVDVYRGDVVALYCVASLSNLVHSVLRDAKQFQYDRHS